MVGGGRGGTEGGTDTQMHTVTSRCVGEWVDGLSTDLLSLNDLDKNEFEIMVRLRNERPT